MKLVLLPGMDGTGILFKDFINMIQAIDVVVIPLPQQGPQDYYHLAKHVAQTLPREPYVLLAESFSGGIVAQLSEEQLKHCKGHIFVASFLRPPMPLALKLALWLPIKQLALLPFTNFVHKLFFLGPNASPELIENFNAVIRQVPQTILKARLKSIQRINVDHLSYSRPAMYLTASNDRLVAKRHIDDFKLKYENLTIASIDGPHFVLQAHPETSARIVENTIIGISKQEKS